MLITLVGLLGLLQAVNIATEQNLRNATREEAMQIAEENMSSTRMQPFDNISSTPGTTYSYAPVSVPSRLRGVSTTYSVLKTVTVLSDTSKMIQVQAAWTFKNKTVSQGLQTVVSRPTQAAP